MISDWNSNPPFWDGIHLPIEMQSMFVIHSINQLESPKDIEAGIAGGCCPHDCAPCAALVDLENSNKLDKIILCGQYDWYQDSSWWDSDRSMVSRYYLKSNWKCLDEGHYEE